MILFFSVKFRVSISAKKKKILELKKSGECWGDRIRTLLGTHKRIISRVKARDPICFGGLI